MAAIAPQCSFARSSSTGNYTLSEEGRVATHTGAAGSWRTTRSVQSFVSGRWVSKFVVLDTKQFMVGVVPATPEQRDNHIAAVAGSGCAYYRQNAAAASIYDTNNGAARADIASAVAGSTIVMTVDFANGTIEWLINNTASYSSNLTTAGLANHALHIAFSAADGAAIRMIADDPTPVVITESKESIDERTDYARTLIRGAAALNILIAGPAGVGKSTFVNTCYTALLPMDEKYTEMIANAGGGRTHVSREFSKYKLPSTRITIGDPWGWTDSNYAVGELSYILNGHIKHGFKMDAAINREALGFHRQPSLDDEIHGAFIVLAADEAKANIDSPSWWTRVEQFRSQLYQHGLFCVLILTKIDLIDEKLSCGDPLAISRSPSVNTLCGQVSTKTGLSLSQIFPMKLNTSERERSAGIEVVAMEALARVVQQAKRYYESKRPNFPAATATTTAVANALLTTNNAPPSSPGACASEAEKLAMAHIFVKAGHIPSPDVLQYLRACNGDIDATVIVLNRLTNL